LGGSNYPSDRLEQTRVAAALKAAKVSMQVVFNIAVVIFTVSNIGAMGLETNLREALKYLRSIRAIGLVLLWGWVVGPALAWLINSLLSLSEGHAPGLLLISLAPTAPFQECDCGFLFLVPLVNIPDRDHDVSQFPLIITRYVYREMING